MLRYLAGITSSHNVDGEMALDTKLERRWASQQPGVTKRISFLSFFFFFLSFFLVFFFSFFFFIRGVGVGVLVLWASFSVKRLLTGDFLVQ